MASLNKVLLIGNLTRDPELRYTPQGTAVVNLRIAVNRRFKDRNGTQKDEVCFITAVVWDKQAESCNQYLQKGRSVFVEGRLQSRSWEDKSGQKRNVIEVRAERVQFLNYPSRQDTAEVAAVGGETKEIPLEDSIDSIEDNSWLQDNTTGEALNENL